MSEKTGVDIAFCTKSAQRWTRLALQTEERAKEAAQYNLEVEAHLREVANSFWMNAARRAIESNDGIDFPVDVSLSPR